MESELAIGTKVIAKRTVPGTVFEYLGNRCFRMTKPDGTAREMQATEAQYNAIKLQYEIEQGEHEITTGY